MNTLIVAAANGFVQRPWAKRVVDKINSLCGDVPAIDISDIIPWRSLTYPPMAKLHIWRIVPKSIERLIWIDSDTYVNRPIFYDDLPTEPFSAVVDPWIATSIVDNKAVGKYALHGQLPLYFNSGFFVARREAIPVFDYAIELEGQRPKDDVDFFREQDSFNWAAWTVLGKQQPGNPGWNRLDEDWNFMYKNRISSTPKPIVVHLAGTDELEKRSILSSLYAGVPL